MKKEEIESLRRRWRDIGRIDLRETLPKADSPFGATEEGLADFRGLNIDQSLHRISLVGLDLSCSEMDEGQFAAKVRQTRFIECRFESNLGDDFADCSFQAAKLANSVLRGSFVRCDFSEANLSSVRASAASFEDCKFDHANLRRASFYDCRFVRCRIVGARFGSGSLAGSTFVDCLVEGADLSKTVLERVAGLEDLP